MAFTTLEAAAVTLFCRLDVAGLKADARASPRCWLSAGRSSTVLYAPTGVVTERF